MERCPACRARLGAEPECPRCGCELHQALRAESDARRLTARALAHLAAGRPRQAETLVRQALALDDDPLIRAVLRLTDQLAPRSTFGSIE